MDGPRINVIGNCGSGKTTLTRELASRLNIRSEELDFHSHGPNWTETPRDILTKKIDEISTGAAWVIDGNYTKWARPILWPRATHVIWLDFPRWLIVARLLRRSTVRAIDKRPLWHGNTESFARWLDPGHPIRWAFTHHKRKRESVIDAFSNPSTSHLQKIILRNPKQVREFLKSARTQLEPTNADL